MLDKNDGTDICFTASRTQVYPRPWAPAKRGRTGAAKQFSGPSGSGSSSGIKREIREDGTAITANHDDTGSDSESEDDGRGPRVDVDFISLLSDDEEGEATPRANRIVPVRVNRVEHKDREPQVNPDNTKKQEEEVVELSDIPHVKKGKGKQRPKDVEVVLSKRSWRGVYQDPEDLLDNIIVKEEEEGEEQPAIADIPRIRTTYRDQEPKTAKPRPKRRSNEVPVFQTDDDKAEWERRQDDLRTIVEELGTATIQSTPDEATASTTQDPAPVDTKQDRVYLFQFPPVVPDLRDMVNDVKDEPQSPVATTTAAPVGAEEIPKPGPSAAEPITVKDDPAPKADLFAGRPTHLPKLESGRVGKVKVYKSGKTTLDWGGTSLQLNMGVTPFCLQDSVMVRLNDPTPENSKNAEAIKGEAMAFGQIRGKFVVTPDWDEVLGKF